MSLTSNFFKSAKSKDAKVEQMRAKRLPNLKDIKRSFDDVSIWKTLGLDFNLSRGSYGVAVIWRIIDFAERADQALKSQSFVEGSDRFILRQSVWAAFDTALDLDRLDQTIREAASGTLSGALHNRLRTLEEVKGNQPELGEWLRESADGVRTQWFAEHIAARPSLIEELHASLASVRSICKQSEWMQATVGKDCVLPELTNDTVLALRAEQREVATRLIGALAAGVSETLGTPRQLSA